MADSVIRFGPFRLDRTQGLRRDAEELRITPKALSVLWELASREGQLVTKQQLFEAVWTDTSVGDSALTSCIQELRHALGDNPRRPVFIETLHRRGYRFIAATSLFVAEGQRPIPVDGQFVGRQRIVTDILESWSLGERGARQVLFLGGEPGIGKTTILRHLLSTFATARGVKATWGQCIEHYGIGEPYQPLLEALMRLCRQPGGGDLVRILDRCAPSWLAQLPALLDPERHATLLRTVTGSTRERMLRELTDALEEATARSPLLFCLEDLQWSDPSTLDWIAAFSQRPEPTRVLFIGTFRLQTHVSGGHPLPRVIEELRIKRCCREITLTGLNQDEVADFINLRLPLAANHAQDLSRLAQLVHRHTGGNPLFVLNVVDDLIARKLVLRDEGGWTLSKELNEIDLGTPDDVRRIIAAQLERLPAADCALLEVASVAGAIFSATTVAGATALPPDDIEIAFTRLARAHRFLRYSGGRFEFDHVLYRDVLYERVPSARRATLHRAIAEREEASRGERASEIAAELAMHFELGGDIQRAGMYLQMAARNAQNRSAFSEARMHFEKALALLVNEPAGRQRTEREIQLWIGLGSAAMAAHGWGAPEAERAYSRARELCHELGESPALFPALWGLWLFYWGRGPLSAAQELARELLVLAQGHGGGDSLLQAHHAAWATAFSQGDLRRACIHANEGIRLYNPDRDAAAAVTYGNHDAGVCARLFLARALALMGRTEAAACASEDAVALARRLQHPFSLALAHVFASAVAQTCRRSEHVRFHADAAATIARDQNFRLLFAWSSAFEAWADAETGVHEEGLGRIKKAISDARTTGSDQFVPHLAGLAADACLTRGNAVDGLAFVADGLRVAARTGERFWEAELIRLRGELQLLQNPILYASEGEQSFREAIELARSQGAMLLALRAAVSLGRALSRSGRSAEASNLISATAQDFDRQTGVDLDEANGLLRVLKGH